LKSLGVDRALARAGARDGDRVRIGTLQFDYET
jgi:Obg family GTPase CgtA-like protein